MLSRKLLLLIPLLFANVVLYCIADPFSFLRNGEYVYYHDTRGTTDFYRGYCIFKTKNGSIVVFMRNLNLSTGKDANIEATLKTDADGKPQITNMRLPSAKPSAEVAQSYKDLLVFLAVRKANLSTIGYDTAVKVPDGDHTLLFHFNRDLPVFGIDTISREGRAPHYIIDRVGTVRMANVDDFLKVRPFRYSRLHESPQVALPKRPTRRVPLGQFTIALDDRWHPIQSSAVATYRLQAHSNRDAQISLEKKDWGHFQSLGYENLDQFARAVIAETPNVLPMTIRVQRAGNAVSCAWQMTDQNDVRNIEFVRFWIQNGSLYVLDFSSLYGIYYKNRGYYAAIFESVQ